MTSPMQKMEEMLSAGKQPSYTDLEDVLAHCLIERNAFQETACDMSKWLSKLVTAHLCKDALAIKDIMDEFIKQRVKIVHAEKPTTH
jgi:hypothetical protein